jgi:hypothetical protein
MPACRGCGHSIREWFTIDLRAVPSLAEAFTPWTLFPLLSCADCSVMFGRHDYEVDLHTMTIRLVNVASSTRRFGSALNTAPHVPQQYVALQPWTFPDGKDPETGPTDPMVGGQPDWIQSPIRVFCRTCRNEMLYVASLTSTANFEPYVPINEAGFHYHFACPRCHTISVIPQCS